MTQPGTVAMDTPPTTPASDERWYPLFTNLAAYSRMRRGSFLVRGFKRWFEERALDRCLRGLDDIHTVCDSPCGPGHLFPYWRRKSLAVIGVDLSDPMVEAAQAAHRALGLAGCVRKGNAFQLKDCLPEAPQPDLVASVRFCYYFDRVSCLELLRSLSAASRRYVLAQYKTTETRKGRRTLSRWRSKQNGHLPKRFCSSDEIAEEITEAGLRHLRIVPISQASDRVFVLAEKIG